MNKNHGIALFGLAIGLMLLAACGNQGTGQVTGQVSKDVPTTPPVQQPIKIGLLLPMTGEAASWGQNAYAGATLAAQEINAKGGINGRKVEYVLEDDQCVPTVGVNAIQKLINVDQVTMILGPVCSSSGGPELPIAQQNGVPTIILTASAPKLTRIGDYIVRIYPSDAFQGKAGAGFIYNKLGKKKVAVVYVKNDWGEGIKTVFGEEYQKMGGTILYEGSVAQTETDFKTELTKVKNSGADILYFPVYPVNVVSAMKQMKEMGMSIPVVGGDAFSGEEVIKNEYTDGVMFTVPKVKNPESFQARIKAVQGFSDLQVAIPAALAYDAANIAFQAMQKVGTDQAKIKDALRATDYAGVSNDRINFDQYGDLKNVDFDYLVIKDKTAVPYAG